MLGAERNADTCLDIDVHSSVGSVIALVQFVDDIHGDVLDILDILLVREAEHEFVAAEASCESAAVIDLLADRVSHESDYLVAYGVSVAVVDELEVVNVDEQRCNALGSAAVDLGGEVPDERISVVQL